MTKSRIFKFVLYLPYYLYEVMLFTAMLCGNTPSHLLKLLFLLFEIFVCLLFNQEWSHKTGFELSSHKKQGLFLLEKKPRRSFDFLFLLCGQVREK